MSDFVCWEQIEEKINELTEAAKKLPAGSDERVEIECELYDLQCSERQTWPPNV